jgi:hypothetical protein
LALLYGVDESPMSAESPIPGSPLKFAGVPLSKATGWTLGMDCAGLMVPDPDDPLRIIVVPLSAVKLIFASELRGVAPKVPEGWWSAL